MTHDGKLFSSMYTYSTRMYAKVKCTYKPRGSSGRPMLIQVLMAWSNLRSICTPPWMGGPCPLHWVAPPRSMIFIYTPGWKVFCPRTQHKVMSPPGTWTWTSHSVLTAHKPWGHGASTVVNCETVRSMHLYNVILPAGICSGFPSHECCGNATLCAIFLWSSHNPLTSARELACRMWECLSEDMKYLISQFLPSSSLNWVRNHFHDKTGMLLKPF